MSQRLEIAIAGGPTQGLLRGFDQVAGKVTGLNGLLRGFGAALLSAAGSAGLAAMGAEALRAADGLGDMAAKIGIAVEDMSRLAYAARQNDVEIQLLQVGLRNLARWMVDTGRGAESISDVLVETADRFAAMPDGAEKAALAVQLFGESALNLIPLLNQGSVGIQQWMAEADRFGVVTKHQAEVADQWDQSTKRLSQSFRGLITTLSAAMAPAITQATNAAAEASAALRRWSEDSSVFRSAMEKMPAVVGSATAAFVGLRVAQAASLALFGPAAIKTIADFVAAVRLIPAAIMGSRVLRFAGWFGVLATAVETAIEAIKLFLTLRAEAANREDLDLVNRDMLARLREENDLREKSGQLTREQAQANRELMHALGEDINQRRFSEEMMSGMLSELAGQMQPDPMAGVSGQEAYLKRMQELRDQFTDTAGLEHHIQKQETLLRAREDANEEDEFWRQQAIKDYQEQNRLIEDQLRTDEERRAHAEAMAEAHRQMIEMQSYTLGTQARFDSWQQSAAVDGAMGMGAGVTAGIQNSLMEMGTAAEQVGRAIQMSIGGALNGISSSIEGLIRGTMGWADAFANVGRAILDAVISAFAQMIAQMIVSFALQKVLGTALKKEAVAVGASWHAAAVSASIATMGTAAGVGVAAFLAAQAAGVGAATGMQAATGFMSGGYTGEGPVTQVAGAVHRREFVFDAPAVDRLGVPFLEGLRQGDMMASAPAQSAPPEASPMRVVIVDNRRDAEQLRRDPRFRSMIVDLMES